MLHAVSPVLDERRVHELVLLGAYAVGERSRIVHAYLLIPSLLAYRMLSLEGVEA